MQTLRVAFGKIVTWQSADGMLDDIGALTASIAHEVSQPPSGILNNANACLLMLAANRPEGDAPPEAARHIIQDGRRSSDVVASLRAMFAASAPTLEPVDVSDAAREVFAPAWHDLQRQSIVVHAELAADLPTVTGDRLQHRQVPRNGCDAMSGVDGRPRQLGTPESVGNRRQS
jgi:C4-dicarboxylate-specific signal transduction histidine kinase